MVFIPPYDDPYIIAGQGTVGTELLRQLSTPDLDRLHAIFVAIGGGGLVAGIAAYVKALRPSVKIYGVEPSGMHAMLCPEFAPLMAWSSFLLPGVLLGPQEFGHYEIHWTWTACMQDDSLLEKAMRSRLLHYLCPSIDWCSPDKESFTPCRRQCHGAVFGKGEESDALQGGCLR